MKAKDYHKSLKAIEAASQSAQWGYLSCSLTGGKGMILIRHFLLVFKCYRHCSFPILIREFSTWPLLLFFPLLWPLRNRLVFLIHHNLQWAVRNRIERHGFLSLKKLGIRWALFETQSLKGAESLHLPSDRNLVLPHPVPKRTGWGGGARSVRPVVGVIGYYRSEKQMDLLVHELKKNCPEFSVLLGIPNPEDVRSAEVDVVCTRSDEQYFGVISRCDVIVFNGERRRYFYRASGPIADAASCKTAVVAPNFPVIKRQVDGIGEIFQSFDDLPDAVRRAVWRVRSGQYNFEAYCAARSPRAIAEKLRQFSDG